MTSPSDLRAALERLRTAPDVPEHVFRMFELLVQDRLSQFASEAPTRRRKKEPTSFEKATKILEEAK
jgi:hypothetical protein